MFEIPTISAITKDLKPGFYRIDNAVYHAGIGLSSSTIKKALSSHAKFLMPYESKDCFNFGTAFHMCALEPELFKKTYVTAPNIPGHKNSNAYKDAYAEFVRSVNGKEVIENSDYQKILDMTTSALAHEECDPSKHQAEVMALSICPGTGVIKKCKADIFGGTIIDLKSTRADLSSGEFYHEILKYGYHISAAYYQDIIGDILGMKPEMKILAVENNKPYDSAMFTLADSLLNEGRKLYKLGMERINNWSLQTQEEIVKTEVRKLTLEANPRCIWNTANIIEALT